MELEGIVVLIITIISSYYIYNMFDEDKKLKKVISNINKEEYKVQDKVDKEIAADILAKLTENIKTLSNHLNKLYSEDNRVKLLLKYDTTKIKEALDNNDGVTSYSINKEEIIMCLRNKDKEKENETLADINTLMYVLLHEISHICTESIGHTPEFWDNFKWILEESINIGIYKYTDYLKENVEYCGITINSTPINVKE